MTEFIDKYLETGYYMARDVLTLDDVNSLIDSTRSLKSIDSIHGIRNLLNLVPEIRKFLLSPKIRNLIDPVLGKNAIPVKSIYFDKNSNANWNVAWHQDTTIAVSKKSNIPGFGPWSEKDQITHVVPPEEILKNILTLRIHLDHSNAKNGGLRAVPGSHSLGRINANQLLDMVNNSTIVECDAEPGDVLLMHPLLFHSSRKSKNPIHRRILHIEYSSSTLPPELDWYENTHQ